MIGDEEHAPVFEGEPAGEVERLAHVVRRRSRIEVRKLVEEPIELAPSAVERWRIGTRTEDDPFGLGALLCPRLESRT